MKQQNKPGLTVWGEDCRPAVTKGLRFFAPERYNERNLAGLICVLIRQRFPILFSPIAVARHRLHGRAAGRTTSARSFGLGLGHARAGF